MHEFHTTRRIEFVDTDLAGICHFSRYFIFIETAEHEFIEALGSSIHLMDGERAIGWPRVAASIQYKSAVTFGDVLDIHLRVKRKGTTSLTYAFTIRCGDREVATAEVTAVCCAYEPGGRPAKIPIPESLAAQIEEAPS